MRLRSLRDPCVAWHRLRQYLSFVLVPVSGAVTTRSSGESKTDIYQTSPGSRWIEDPCIKIDARRKAHCIAGFMACGMIASIATTGGRTQRVRAYCTTKFFQTVTLDCYIRRWPSTIAEYRGCVTMNRICLFHFDHDTLLLLQTL